MPKYNISFAGAGRVASAICSKAYMAGHGILQIVSPGEKNGRQLADSCGALWSDKPVFSGENDLIIVAVPDAKLEAVLSDISFTGNTVVAHTAGSYGLEVFPQQINHKGVIYPLQTFTLNRELDFTRINFFTEASDNYSDNVLKGFAQSLGSNVLPATAGQRAMLHIAAVFACNFTNYMLTAAKEVTARSEIPFEVLEPLIRETINKGMEIGPENSQTGPAVRKDHVTISKHLEMLSFSPGLRELYRLLSESIINHYNKGQQ
ncbi:MAG: DUF2520 domain-containing protein [Bacteroidales bacterium]|nr:DUF2520 domain-containing protein [Bacteroidales bacterium]